MDYKKLLKYSAVLIFSIFLMNYLALRFHWYFSIWYFDMLMHFLGGIWLGFISIYLFNFDSGSKKSFFNIIVAVFVVGVGWEIFEIVVNAYTTENAFNFLDTISDLFFDTAGGVFALLYFLKKNSC
ncbi:MAG: hypothetical protein NDI62_01180 [Burkholderiales bacterium]|nr:hypothetical protein [Burkholderiales bacterium]